MTRLWTALALLASFIIFPLLWFILSLGIHFLFSSGSADEVIRNGLTVLAAWALSPGLAAFFAPISATKLFPKANGPTVATAFLVVAAIVFTAVFLSGAWLQDQRTSATNNHVPTTILAGIQMFSTLLGAWLARRSFTKPSS